MEKELVLISLSSAEIDLRSWCPEKLDEVYVCLDIEIGSDDNPAESNMFYVTLATPEGLKKGKNGTVLVRNRTIVISQFDIVAVENEIKDIISLSKRKTWEESCMVLQRFFQWEYEDYNY